MKNVIYEVQISIVGQMEECTQYKNKLKLEDQIQISHRMRSKDGNNK